MIFRWTRSSLAAAAASLLRRRRRFPSLRNSATDAGISFELIGGCRVDVELGGSCRLRRGGCTEVRRRDRWATPGTRAAKARSARRPSRCSQPARRINAALANRISHAVDGQHVKLRCDCSPYGLGVANHIAERRNHDLFQPLVDHGSLPELDLAVLHPLEIRGGHPPALARMSGDNHEDPFLR